MIPAQRSFQMIFPTLSSALIFMFFSLAELRVVTRRVLDRVQGGLLMTNLGLGLKPQPVAVKLLDLDGLQGHREWLAELILS
ncbi:hypothetical protein GBA52_028341 [Prunus armeniaca]|nr:hypothetical protein GBA52_028341 [Prunus armeniaca]